ncbi:PhzF family phenazine biosynthesis protein [Actinokineospora bangkokensis]|uniref:Phenazine biosynthesis protein PhzF n=1 Tax=Actinokineospora bangkokensis TaxID=1193682 RepID=A0A1Q9LJ04_9PSEU|nr:PhzF family phenazine biosynthesis isomerase [Actinokineospora bangkokensis]OLR91959.1 phenazine biosynthesis protein PhzF [Actinokineospora bangkokensis]
MQPLTYTAFTTDPAGGNPAGVVLDAAGAPEADLQRVAAAVGFSETAFVVGGQGRDLRIRYFSPLAEVPFCGHATIATAVAHAHEHGVGELRLQTAAGPVVVTSSERDGVVSATLVSVEPRLAPLDDVEPLLTALGWSAADLDPGLPVRVAYAGAWHPVVAARTRERLADLEYDFDALSALMAERGWTTVALVHRESAGVFHARNPFPPGGVVEDPATGAAAAALGGYLRELGLVEVPARFVLHQGQDMGRAALIEVSVGPVGGIAVTGAAVPL